MGGRVWEPLDEIISKLSAWSSILCFYTKGFDPRPPTKRMEPGRKWAMESFPHQTKIRASFYCLHSSLPVSRSFEASQDSLGLRRAGGMQLMVRRVDLVWGLGGSGWGDDECEAHGCGDTQPDGLNPVPSFAMFLLRSPGQESLSLRVFIKFIYFLLYLSHGTIGTINWDDDCQRALKNRNPSYQPLVL